MRIEPIPGFDDYEISESGFVISRKYNKVRVLKPKLLKRSRGNQQPRLYVILYQDGKAYTRHVHRLVLETFVGPRPEGQVCCHKDGDALNNGLTNLEWNTQGENMLQATEHGTHPSRQKRKLNDKQITLIRLSTASCSKLAEIFGVSAMVIHKIKARKTYK